jgi:hypothetical protein
LQLHCPVNAPNIQPELFAKISPENGDCRLQGNFARGQDKAVITVQRSKPQDLRGNLNGYPSAV